MKRITGILMAVAVLLILPSCLPTEGGGVKGSPGDILNDVLKGMGGQPGGPAGGQAGSLSDADMTAGLKEALKVGTVNAVGSVSAVDGYLANTIIKILLPEEIRKYEDPLRLVGFGPQIDRFVVSMNRAAEKAAPFAKDLFWDAVKQMTFTDAKNILFGAQDAATRYFREKTETKLSGLFNPVVHQAMAQVGVTSQYQKIYGQLNTITLGQFKNFDLDAYVTGRALDGLFYMVAQEEKKIRTNPAARVTDILKKVFGSN